MSEEKKALQQVTDQALEAGDRQSLVDALLYVDVHGGPHDREVEALVTRALWAHDDRSEGVGWLGHAWLLYRLQDTIEAPILMADGTLRLMHVKRWQVWESALAKRDGRDPDYTWKQFCSDTLGMGTSKASSMKRAWEVYVITMGYSADRLLVVGKSILQMAAPRFEKDWRKGFLDDKLQALVFGDRHLCFHCRQFVAYDEFNRPPEKCPHCGEDFESLPGATYQQVEAHLEMRRNEDQAPPEGETHFEFSLGGEAGDQRRPVMVWLRRPGALRPVPYRVAVLNVEMGKVDPETAGEAALSADELETIWEKLNKAISKAGK